jgi:RNA polymerase sigma factor (sigma-70 family)
MQGTKGGRRAHASALTGTSPETTTRLLERSRGGDSVALNELFGRQVSALRRWASGRLPQWARDATDTQDLVQETALHAFTRLHAFTPRQPGSFQAYLRQAIANDYRRVNRHPAAEAIDEALPATLTSPLAAVIRGEERERYERALSRLAEADRDLLIGRLDLGLTYEELAERSGRPSWNAARMAVGRALLRLAREIPRD